MPTKTKIVYLDDSEIMLELVKYTLEAQGFEVYTVSSWPELNPYLFKEKIRILLCDLEMPGLKGDKLIPVLKESIPDLKIILFSSKEPEELESLSHKLGVKGWISKTQDKSQWSKTLSDLLSPKVA